MGMFDTILCKKKVLPVFRKLPPTEKKYLESKSWHEGWQTKDLECTMQTYTLATDGLFQHQYKRVKRTKQEYAKVIKRLSSSSFDFLKEAYKTKQVRIKDKRYPYHGQFEMHDIKDICGREYYISLLAKMTDGEVEKITLQRVERMSLE